MLTTLLAAAIVWFLLACVVAPLIGRAIRLRDLRRMERHEVHALSVDCWCNPTTERVE